MNRAQSPTMSLSPLLCVMRSAIFAVCAAGFFLLPAIADEKEGMPDLCQVDQTCLPTATTNLLVWFGLHGYPKLIADGDSKSNGYIHTVRRIMTATDASFDLGTLPDLITGGVQKYIDAAGYNGTVEFRGLGKTPFTSDWLKDNDAPNKGFILLLAYCAHDASSDTYVNAWNAGHAVTLVNSMPGMILVHDPAHYDDEPGRKILTPQILTSGTWRARAGSVPVAGLMLLSGSLLDTPPNAGVMLVGAVCITMHPNEDRIASSAPGSAAAPVSTIGSTPAPSPTSSTPAAPVSDTKGWVEWVFDLLFSK